MVMDPQLQEEASASTKLPLAPRDGPVQCRWIGVNKVFLLESSETVVAWDGTTASPNLPEALDTAEMTEICMMIPNAPQFTG